MTKQEKIKQLETDVKVQSAIIERLRLCQTRLTERLNDIISQDNGNNAPSLLTSEKMTCLAYGDMSQATWYEALSNRVKFDILNRVFGTAFHDWIVSAFEEPYAYKSIGDAMHDGLHVLTRQAQREEVAEEKVAAEEGETK